MGISVDVSEIEGFVDKIKNLNTGKRDIFFRESCNELANRFLSLVKPATPAVSGILRKGWDTAKANANVTMSGRSYSITLVNPVEYGSYVEFGHRQTPGRYVPKLGKRLKASWVEGKHFVSASEETLQPLIPTVLQRRLDNVLRTVF